MTRITTKPCERALISIGKVIAASAATVGLTFLGISFARMGVFSTVGVSSAIGVGVAFLPAVTLLPAILVVAGPRGWVKPRRELTARFLAAFGDTHRAPAEDPPGGQRAGVDHPGRLCGPGALQLRRPQGRAASAPSSLGYAALDRHFPVNQSIPEYILVQSPHDLRTPRALADLEQMADRVSQLPNIAAVSGITRPTGAVPEEFRATYQAGAVGARLGEGSTLISDHKDDLNRLVKGADTLADNLGDVRGQVSQMVSGMQGLLDSFSSMRSQHGGDTLVRDVATAAKLVNSINALGTSMGLNFTAVKDMFAWVAPVLVALQGNPVCDLTPRAAPPACNSSEWSTRATTEASTRSMIWPANWRPSRTDKP